MWNPLSVVWFSYKRVAFQGQQDSNMDGADRDDEGNNDSAKVAYWKYLYSGWFFNISFSAVSLVFISFLCHYCFGKIKIEQNSKMDGDDRENDWKNESSNKNHNQASDVSRGSSSKFGWFPSNSSSTDSPIPKASPSTSRKSSLKGEVGLFSITDTPQFFISIIIFEVDQNSSASEALLHGGV